MHTCEYCDTSFTNKSNLSFHKKNAKYCLSKRDQPLPTTYTCKACGKILTTSQRLGAHVKSCSKHTITPFQEKIQLLESSLDENIENFHRSLLDQKMMYESKLAEQKEEYEIKINNLQDKLENVAIKAASRSTTTNKVSNFIQNMAPLTEQVLRENLHQLTIEHIKKGAEGYAQYALEFPLKDRVACVDYSRKKIKFKDHDGNTITDPEMSFLTQKFFKSIKERNKELFVECTREMRDKVDEDSFNIMSLVAESYTGVNEGSEGTTSDFTQEFVKEVCKKTIRE
jgi:hypothetical protein